MGLVYAYGKKVVIFLEVRGTPRKDLFCRTSLRTRDWVLFQEPIRA